MSNQRLLISCYRNWKKKYNYFFILVLLLLDCLNQKLFHFKLLDRFVFSEMKSLLFKVQGSCRHSGKCCQFLQIKYDGTWIDQEDKFNRIVKKDKSMSRFIPKLKKGLIDYFTCTCLTTNNLCSKYESRPKFCRTYPFSVLVTDGVIHPGCGFYITEKQSLPSFASAELKQKIWAFKFNQNIKVSY